jgi:methylated-DNA-[protein]-cysteine S-methyltransferase
VSPAVGGAWILALACGMRHCLHPSPVGPLRLASDGDALCLIEFEHPRHPARWANPWPAGDDPVLRDARRQLDAYFDGSLRRFDLPLAARGTAFQHEVWTALREIAYGRTMSYAELAERIGKPNSTRAVGAANGRNPLPIVVPCHRVIGADGSLTGFGGGLPVKRFLLALEGARETSDLFAT